MLCGVGGVAWLGSIPRHCACLYLLDGQVWPQTRDLHPHQGTFVVYSPGVIKHFQTVDKREEGDEARL